MLASESMDTWSVHVRFAAKLGMPRTALSYISMVVNL